MRRDRLGETKTIFVFNQQNPNKPLVVVADNFSKDFAV